MSWTRLDDTWGDDPVFDNLNHQARWHYLMMIQVCSRGERYDGTMRFAKARNCSDVDDPTGCIGDLIATGLVENVDGDTLRLVRIDRHLPPQYMRDPERKARQRERKARQRAKSSEGVPRDVTRDPGTGQDGSGQEVPPPVTSEDVDRSDEYLDAWGDDLGAA